MSRPPSRDDWLPALAWVGAGIISVLCAPGIAVESGPIIGTLLAAGGLGCLLVALYAAKQVIVAQVRWVGEQQIAELRRREAEVSVRGGDTEDAP